MKHGRVADLFHFDFERHHNFRRRADTSLHAFKNRQCADSLSAFSDGPMRSWDGSKIALAFTRLLSGSSTLRRPTISGQYPDTWRWNVFKSCEPHLEANKSANLGASIATSARRVVLAPVQATLLAVRTVLNLLHRMVSSTPRAGSLAMKGRSGAAKEKAMMK